MKNLRILFLIGCLVYLSAFLAPKAKADLWDQKTTISFSQPVELPGIVLPAGTYVFKLYDFGSNRNFVQVLSQDEKKIYALIRTIPDYRVNHAGNTTSVVLEERAAGAPHAIKEWYGHEFVYPKIEAGELAKADEPENANKPAESAEPQSPEVQSMKNEPATVEHPEQTMPAEAQLPPQPEQQTEAQPPPQAQQEPQPEVQQPEVQQTPQQSMPGELPTTASFLPLTGLLGMLLVAGAFGLRFLFRED